jgi:Kef-type K+ transport system membrane component KefB/nucleotide-binding universal stress UspA family protein
MGNAGQAAAQGLQESGAGSEVVFLAQIMVFLVVGRLLGEAMQRVGQPSVMGQLLAGILLGPSVLGSLWPGGEQWLFPSAQEQKAMIDAVAQFGILMLLLLTGMETDLKLVRQVGKAAISISLAGVAVPFACGVALGQFMPESLLPDPHNRLLTSLFLGTALSISSIKIVAAVVREMNFSRRNLGQIILASAIMDDTIGWIIIAITFGLAQAGHIDLGSVGRSLLGTAFFLLLSFTIGRRVVFWIIRWANDHFTSDFPVITTILVIMGAMALITHFIGVHTVLGAFVAGILVGQSPILTKHIDEQLRGLILAFFMPVFFGLAGLGADLTILKSPALLSVALLLIAIASVGKFGGAFLGGKIGGLSMRESLALGCAMNARGSTEVIVASIGLSLGALSRDLFTMIVAMALVTTMAMPPMLRWTLARVPLRKAERERLQREELEARGFVPNLERLLIAVDQSANGRFTSRLAGLLAGSRGLPTTVLALSNGAGANGKHRQEDATNEAEAKEAVKTASEEARANDDEPARATDVTTRTPKASTAEAVASEAKKGYDLLFVGMQKMRRKDAFHPDLMRIAGAFDGPLALVEAKGEHLEQPERSPLRILIPVNGTDVSRRAAEVAITIARLLEAPIKVLYVSNSRTGGRARRQIRARRHEQAILKDVVELAEQYDQKITTAVRADVAPDEAIIKEAEREEHDLIVMGVSRRPGGKLFFGDTAARVFENARASILFLES